MGDALATILEELHALGYQGVTRDERYGEASGRVPIATEDRASNRTGWRSVLPRLSRDGGDPTLVPADLRAVVERHGWTVQAMGRSGETVTVVISENGV